jgi:hypothetical protein
MTLVDTTTPEEPMACRARARVERRLALIDATITLIAEYCPSGTIMARVSVPIRCTQNGILPHRPAPELKGPPDPRDRFHPLQLPLCPMPRDERSA